MCFQNFYKKYVMITRSAKKRRQREKRGWTKFEKKELTNAGGIHKIGVRNTLLTMVSFFGMSRGLGPFRNF